jgi:predicted RNA-binding protein YlxR (DUF448 family)
MTDLAHITDETNDTRGARADARERRDIVSGEVMPDSRLMRFVAGPDGVVVPDASAKLPGRGLWVEASRKAVDTAVEKKLFSRAAKRPASGGEPSMKVTATADLADRAEKALVTRMLGDLGIARRSGQLAAGFRQCAARPGRFQAAQGADRSL